jgi:hypothetical protein
MSYNISAALNKGRVLLAPFIILGAGALAFSLVVSADDSTTSVVVSNSTPTVSVSFNGGSSSAIDLTEATYKWATVTVTATDANGCFSLNHISAVAFLASTTAASSTGCLANDNSCYPVGSSTVQHAGSNALCVASSTNLCTGGADTSVVYDCGIRLWYIAEATAGTGADWTSSIWTAVATVSDGIATNTASNTAQTQEINSLAALDVTPTLSYGTLSPSSNTGALNSTTTATTTGNIAIDSNVKGDSDGFMDSGPNTLAIGYQEWSTAPFSHGAGTDLTVSDTRVEFTTGNPTSTTSPLAFPVPWGIEIPGGQANGTYTGTNTFTAIAD